jgi:hypothetical protein
LLTSNTVWNGMQHLVIISRINLLEKRLIRKKNCDPGFSTQLWYQISLFCIMTLYILVIFAFDMFVLKGFIFVFLSTPKEMKYIKVFFFFNKQMVKWSQLFRDSEIINLIQTQAKFYSNPFNIKLLFPYLK